MSIKLEYFNIHGIAESIRYMLHYSNQPFEDVRYNYENWSNESIRNTVPYGRLPIYHEDGRSINQSLAIARYVGHKGKLVPLDLWEQAVLDAAALNIHDFLSEVFQFTRETDPTRKEEIKNKIIDEKIDFYFSKFEKDLQTNNGHFGKKLSWVDFVFVGITDTTKFIFGEDTIGKYPAVLALGVKIRSLPRVQEYISTRPSYYI